MQAEIQLDMFSGVDDDQNDMALMRSQRMLCVGGMRTMELKLAHIRLVPHDGQWMWSVSVCSANGFGQAYKPLPKWGKMAPSREGALERAADELRALIGRMTDQEQKRVIDWLGSVLSKSEYGGN